MSVASPVTTWVSGSGRLHHQTISIIVENRAGVLARIAALFARRGFNIISLAVAPTDDDAFSRVTIVVDLEETSVEQLTKQLFKLVNVVKITELTPGEAIERELALLSVRCAPPGAPGPSAAKSVTWCGSSGARSWTWARRRSRSCWPPSRRYWTISRSFSSPTALSRSNGRAGWHCLS